MIRPTSTRSVRCHRGENGNSETGWVLLLAGAGALLMAVGGSWWVARTVARPIDRLSNSLATMAKARDFDRPLPPTGGSRELDTLTATFNELRTAVSLAEAESEAAYLGVIGALATALDARDPYTAGHSQRVADLSVAIGRQMQLSDPDLETLRLGALLHDIGKDRRQRRRAPQADEADGRGVRTDQAASRRSAPGSSSH